MAKFVPDVKTQRWVVIAPWRTFRPEDLQNKTERKQKNVVCPFCPGNEFMTPPEVWRIGGEGKWNKPGWKVRVVPNKFRITDVHEVIIHSPDDIRDVDRLELSQVELVIQAYRQRFIENQKNGQVLIFCNHGESAGASLRHPHSQLVVLPNQIKLDVLSREPFNNVIDENNHFVTYCPDFSQWPYEVWIAPKVSGTMFGEIKDNEISDLVGIMQNILVKLRDRFFDGVTPKVAREEDFTYNYYIYHGIDWYLRIIPRFVHRAGFELGTGLSVNIKDPAEAMKELM
jgi:UDPglucose--hexose-1-phosphate uridylyltransferase